tara:strand:+ start:68 stop:514 length:447 start_codon:yes stop_codon:yes gene_type:complete
MKKLLLILICILSFNISHSQNNDEVNVNLSVEDVTRNRVGAFNSARMKEWRNMRARRLQKYTYKPSKKTALKLYRANKVIGMPLDAGIAPEHVEKWLPKINLDNKVEIISRDEAVERLKEAKELFDDGILTKEEFNKISNKLKPIIID